LLCLEGLLGALRVFLKKDPHREYKLKQGNERMIVDKSVR